MHASRHAPALRLQRILARPLVGSGGLDASGANEVDASALDASAPGASELGSSGLGSSRPDSPGRHREPAAFPTPFACAAGKAAEGRPVSPGRQSPRQAGLLDRSHSPKLKPSWL